MEQWKASNHWKFLKYSVWFYLKCLNVTYLANYPLHNKRWQLGLFIYIKLLGEYKRLGDMNVDHGNLRHDLYQ